MNIIEEKIIVDTFMDIVKNGKFPEFGSPEYKCDKCLFHEVACKSYRKDVVGCFHGWKKE